MFFAKSKPSDKRQTASDRLIEQFRKKKTVFKKCRLCLKIIMNNELRIMNNGN